MGFMELSKNSFKPFDSSVVKVIAEDWQRKDECEGDVFKGFVGGKQLMDPDR
jgi:hypothetical protein